MIRVGFETLASPTPLPGGGVHLEIDAHRLPLLAEDSTEPWRVGSTAALDLPPGYAAILRLPQPRESLAPPVPTD